MHYLVYFVVGSVLGNWLVHRFLIRRDIRRAQQRWDEAVRRYTK